MRRNHFLSIPLSLFILLTLLCQFLQSVVNAKVCLSSYHRCAYHSRSFDCCDKLVCVFTSDEEVDGPMGFQVASNQTGQLIKEKSSAKCMPACGPCLEKDVDCGKKKKKCCTGLTCSKQENEVTGVDDEVCK